MTNFKLAFIGLVFCVVCSTIFANAQTTQFTYQGKLSDSGAPANSSYDFVFTLWDASTNGAQIGSVVSLQNTQVVNGIFSVQLDFGVAAFSGAARYLEITVKPSGNPGMPLTLLTPRQLVTSTPYAIKSLGAVSADSLSVSCVNCITSNQIAGLDGSKITGTIAVGSIPAGSTNYIQNTTSQQASSNFNISGTGKADIIDATSQYNLGGFRILSNAGTNNLFAGIGAGVNTTGGFNSFFGYTAGLSNTTGSDNSFFGSGAGTANTIGNANAFFGKGAGFSNTTGNSNSIFGSAAGLNNTTGNNNSFFGNLAGAGNTSGFQNAFFGGIAGRSTTTGFNNVFFGYAAGFANTTGTANSFFGTNAGSTNMTGGNNAFVGSNTGQSNSTGNDNAFLGKGAGFGNTTGNANSFFGTNAGVTNSGGSNNTIIGAEADVTTATLTNATAIGYQAAVGSSDSLILGSINGVNGATADTNVGIGTTTPLARLHVSGNGIIRARVNSDANAGLSLTLDNQPKWAVATVTGGNFLINNDAVGLNALTIDGASNNVGIGTASPSQRLHVVGNGLFTGNLTVNGTLTGSFAAASLTGVVATANGGTGLSMPGAGGSYLRSNGSTWASSGILATDLPAGNSNYIQNTAALQSSSNFNISGNGLIGGIVGIGTTTPQARLHVNGIIRADALGASGVTSLCRNANNEIATCSSSLRYKTEVQTFTGGLNIINRLRPITFTWKEGGMRDVGFGAEEVAKVEPLLTFHNDMGEIEGVKYAQISAVLVNAIKEQQAQIASQQQQVTWQQEQLQHQQQEIALLKQWYCRTHPKAALCQTAKTTRR